MRKWLIFAVVIILCDQATKAWALGFLNHGHPVAVTSFFNLTLVYNMGAAFGFLAKAGGWQRHILAAIAIAASIILLILLNKHQRNTQLAYAFSLLLGGAIGNVIDRFMYGYVVDFLDFYYANYHWPAFNIADSAIFIGAVLIVLDSLKSKR